MEGERGKQYFVLIKTAVNLAKILLTATLGSACMIGRKQEVDELNRIYNRNKAELVAIYGRRRFRRHSNRFADY